MRTKRPEILHILRFGILNGGHCREIEVWQRFCPCDALLVKEHSQEWLCHKLLGSEGFDAVDGGGIERLD
jgi:hypothetical protein